MSILVALYLMMIPAAVLLMAVSFLKRVSLQIFDWRDLATRFALGIGILAGIIILSFAVRVGMWPDPSAPVGSMLGLGLLLKWGHWGFWITLVAFVTALFARKWDRVILLLSSVFFASFWLVGYIVTEAQ